MPSSASTRLAQADAGRCRAGSAPPGPSSSILDDQAPALLEQRDLAPRRRGVLGGVGQRLGDDEVGGGLDDRRAAGARCRASTFTGSAERSPSESTAAAQAAVGQHRRGDAAGEVAQLLDRVGGLDAGVARPARRPRGVRPGGPRRGRAACSAPPAGPARRRAGRARSGAAPRPGRPARRGACGSARRRARVSSCSRAGCSARHQAVISACRTSAALSPNSGQNSQKPKPVSAQMNVRIAAGDARQRGVDDSARHCRGPLSARRIAYCTRDRDRQPEPDPDRPEVSPKPVAAQIPMQTAATMPDSAACSGSAACTASARSRAVDGWLGWPAWPPASPGRGASSHSDSQREARPMPSTSGTLSAASAMPIGTSTRPSPTVFGSQKPKSYISLKSGANSGAASSQIPPTTAVRARIPKTRPSGSAAAGTPARATPHRWSAKRAGGR